MVEACTNLAEQLLRHCPDLRVLATSRGVLGISGETSRRVPSLGVPERVIHHSIEEVARSEAARLFVVRAQAVLPEFEINERNAPHVAELCRQLDGIPLALDLAAARMRVLAVEHIVERLNNRFGLLTVGNRAALPRQQTLRATSTGATIC